MEANKTQLAIEVYHISHIDGGYDLRFSYLIDSKETGEFIAQQLIEKQFSGPQMTTKRLEDNLWMIEEKSPLTGSDIHIIIIKETEIYSIDSFKAAMESKRKKDEEKKKQNFWENVEIVTEI